MHAIIREFIFLTAGFPHGAYQSQGFDRPELRGPSVKGQLRWWFDALFGNSAAEDKLFGGLKNKRAGEGPGPESSRVIVRVSSADQVDPEPTDYMPHSRQKNSKKNAIAPGTRYKICLSSRRGILEEGERMRLECVLDAWLLAGAVGQRANRAAGSLWPDNAPATEQAYLERTTALLKGSKLRCAVLPSVFEDERALRLMAGDLIEGTQSWWPFGSAEPRKPSTLKFRAARLDGRLRLVAVWDGRYQASDNLRRGIEELAKSKPLGRFLKQVEQQLYS